MKCVQRSGWRSIAKVEGCKLHLFSFLKIAHLELGCEWVCSQSLRHQHLVVLDIEGELGWDTANHHLGLTMLGLSARLLVYPSTKRSRELLDEIEGLKEEALAHPEVLEDPAYIVRIDPPARSGILEWTWVAYNQWGSVLLFWRRWNWQEFTLATLSFRHAAGSGWDIQAGLFGVGVDGFQIDKAVTEELGRKVRL